MQSCSSARSVLILLLIIFITGSESAVHVVEVKYKGTAVLPCTERCTGVVSWTPSHKSSDILAECDGTSCRSVKEGYQMIYNQYLQGDFSLIITEADFSKRGQYSCDCDGVDKCDVVLQIKALETSVPIDSGRSLQTKLEVSDPVEVIYRSTGAAAGFSDQICTVIGGSLQCKPEYKHRTSLLSSSSVLELRDMKESDSGVYTIQTIRNKEDLHIYTVTVNSKDFTSYIWTTVLLVILLIGAGITAFMCMKKKKDKKDIEDLKKEIQKWREHIQELESKIKQMTEEIQKLERKNNKIQELEIENNKMKENIQELEKHINLQNAEIQKYEKKIDELQKSGWKPELIANEWKQIQKQKKKMQNESDELKLQAEKTLFLMLAIMAACEQQRRASAKSLLVNQEVY